MEHVTFCDGNHVMGETPCTVAGRKPFQLTELFGGFVHMPIKDYLWTEPKPCHECGGAILMPDKHVEWHNKVADL